MERANNQHIARHYVPRGKELVCPANTTGMIGLIALRQCSLAPRLL